MCAFCPPGVAVRTRSTIGVAPKLQQKLSVLHGLQLQVDVAGSAWPTSEHDDLPRLSPFPRLSMINPNRRMIGHSWDAGSSYSARI